MKEDCQTKHLEQVYLHREEVQWGVLGIGFIGAIAGLWFGGRRVSSAARGRLRRIIREEIERRAQ